MAKKVDIQALESSCCIHCTFLQLDSPPCTYNHLHTACIHNMFVNSELVEAGKAVLLSKHSFHTINTTLILHNTVHKHMAAILDLIPKTVSPKLWVNLLHLSLICTILVCSNKPSIVTNATYLLVLLGDSSLKEKTAIKRWFAGCSSQLCCGLGLAASSSHHVTTPTWQKMPVWCVCSCLAFGSKNFDRAISQLKPIIYFL